MVSTGRLRFLRPKWSADPTNMEIHENAARFCGHANTGHLLVRKTSDLAEICGGDERSDKRKREGKVNPHKTDSPLVPGPDDPLR